MPLIVGCQAVFGERTVPCSYELGYASPPFPIDRTIKEDAASS